jgi:hypothetical protein
MSKCNIGDIYNYLFFLRKYKNDWYWDKNSKELEQQTHPENCNEIFKKIKEQNSIDTEKPDNKLTNNEINLLEFQIWTMMKIKTTWNLDETLPTVLLQNNDNTNNMDIVDIDDNDDDNKPKTWSSWLGFTSTHNNNNNNNDDSLDNTSFGSYNINTKNITEIKRLERRRETLLNNLNTAKFDTRGPIHQEIHNLNIAIAELKKGVNELYTYGGKRISKRRNSKKTTSKKGKKNRKSNKKSNKKISKK